MQMCRNASVYIEQYLHFKGLFLCNLNMDKKNKKTRGTLENIVFNF